MRRDKDVLTPIIENLLESQKPLLYGVTDPGDIGFVSDFKCALILAVPHQKILTIETYSESVLENEIRKAGERLNKILAEIESVLKENSFDYLVPTSGQQNETELKAMFSFKDAAAGAGIGWIGKNDLLITPDYGPRIRLSAVLINGAMKASKPVLKSRCSDECRACIDACPDRFLYGEIWEKGKKRDEFLDFKGCNDKRSLFLKFHNRKNACGLCLVSCPYGINNM